MGKTPKKAAPGGDERNLYVRRLKATTATSETAAGASLPEKQRESESSNRPKLTGVQKKVPAVAGKKFKSKLRSPAKLSLTHQSKRSSKPSSAAQEQKPAEESTKRTRTPTPTMQTETGEAEMKQDTPVQEEAAAEENGEKKKNDESEETSSKDESDRPIAQEILNQECENTKEAELPETPVESQVSESEPCETRTPEVKESEEQEESDIKLSLDAEESPAKSQKEPENNLEEDEERRVEESDSNAVQEEVKSVSTEKEDPQSEQHTDTESYSVDIVESTTSEISETSESVSPCEPQKEKDNKPAEVSAKDASFVSYDASIMLKDVQIKLNDCLKDSSKLFDASNSESSPQVNRLREMSFGKTLRSISGRSSLNRMRHVTVRENRFSPNSSLFVNTSTISLPSEESSECKVLRYASNLSETFPTNGSPVERKRKLDLGAWSSAKKRRTETDSGLLDASMGLLKGLRKPVQVSTPSVAGYKFRSDKLNASDITDDEEKVLADGNEGGRKWCVVM